jgi:hypothetical protein
MKGLLVRLGILLAGGAVLAVACQKTPDRPAQETACSGDAWTQACVSGGNYGGGTEAGDAAREGEAQSDAGVTLSGVVFGLQSDDFTTSVAYDGTATISAQRASGLLGQTSYDGSAYVFNDAPFTNELWVKTEPQLDGKGAPYLPTLVPVDTTLGGQIDLPIVAGTTLDLIYAAVSFTTQRQTGHAQLVLAFVDSAGKPAAGHTITSPAASSIIYSTSGAWSDTVTVTDNVALVLIPNVVPGVVPVSIDNSQGTSLEAEADTVTLASIQIH